ncbi:hypothetical protein F4804DRAFT_308014 [Jackrogersella minutella]|nr:hypothetical protein F4804DRAFT_308014 [Jackrogersella minutella]
MASRSLSLRHSGHHTQVQLVGNHQQKQSLQGVGAQFEDANVDFEGMLSALEALPSDPRAASLLLGAILARSVATDKARARLLNSGVVASLSPRRPH